MGFRCYRLLPEQLNTSQGQTHHRKVKPGSLRDEGRLWEREEASRVWGWSGRESRE